MGHTSMGTPLRSLSNIIEKRRWEYTSESREDRSRRHLPLLVSPVQRCLIFVRTHDQFPRHFPWDLLLSSTILITIDVVSMWDPAEENRVIYYQRINANRTSLLRNTFIGRAGFNHSDNTTSIRRNANLIEVAGNEGGSYYYPPENRHRTSWLGSLRGTTTKQ